MTERRRRPSSPPPAPRRRRSARLALFVLALLGGSCSKPGPDAVAPGPASPGAAGDLLCRDTWQAPPPPLEPAPPLTWPTSHLSLTARVPVSAVVDELSKQVPERLVTNQRRGLGAAGRATYSVRRGTPRLVAKSGALEVQVPIEADVDVCKPFGSTCIRYGGCRPAFLATFRVADALDERYRLAPPRGSLEATRRCVIGIDVTPRILEEARKEIRNVERTLERSLPDLEQEASQLWRAVQAEERLGEDTCLRFVPQALTHTPARLSRDHLELELGLSGDLQVGACGSRTTPVPLPPLKNSAQGAAAGRTRRDPDAPVKSEVNLPRQVHFHTIAEAIDEQLVLPEGTELAGLEVTAHGARLAVRLGLRGASCGDVWLSALPSFDPTTGQISLTDARAEDPDAGPGGDLARELARSLAGIRSDTPVATERVAELVQGWLRRARKATRGVDFALTFAPPSRGQAWVHPEGVLVAAVIEPEATLIASALNP
ncbi:MAG: DUF4403 family protein [Myxococcales bacterium]|nr:DUF4403 family protein [Myxococcales bacterium]